MDLEGKLAALENMSSRELRATWQRLTGEVAPRVSPKLLRHALAWELQAKAHGGLPRKFYQGCCQSKCIADGQFGSPEKNSDYRLLPSIEWTGFVRLVRVAVGGYFDAIPTRRTTFWLV